MSDSLFELLQPSSATPSARNYGVAIGIVTNNQDPDGLGRVKVRFPWLNQEDESWWGRVAAPMAGAKRGAYFLPEVDDEVLVAFEHGDIRFPYILGGLWNGVDRPPADNQDGKNNIRVIQSRSGHIIRFDDTEGAEKIEILDQTAKNSVVIDAAANTITVQADGDILLKSAQGNIVIEGQQIQIKAAAQAVQIEASANLELKAGGQANIKGSVVNIN